MGASDIARKLLDFLAGEVPDQMAGVTPDTDLFETGILDSFRFLGLISYLETEFSLAFSPADLTEDNVRSVAALTALVERLTRR